MTIENLIACGNCGSLDNDVWSKDNPDNADVKMRTKVGSRILNSEPADPGLMITV